AEQVGPWSADLLCDRPRAGVDVRSGAVLRLAEDLACASQGLDPGCVRVAALPPSGRPVAMVDGAPAWFAVSVSHVRSLVGAVLSDAAWVGIDIVDPADAGRALDVWFTPDELSLLPDDHGLLRAMLWSAKEAAYKAARLDTEFRPRTVTIEQLTPHAFEWVARDGHAEAFGDGCYGTAGRHLIAVAATPIRGADMRETQAVHPATEFTSFNQGASA
ncbi:MAG: 4'-phosphopantetheinyl transferase family protein, partial [Planctomycetia bacterium]